MLEEVEKIKEERKQWLMNHYRNCIHNTLRHMNQFVQITDNDIRELVMKVKERYKITDDLDAMKKTLRNIEDVLIQFEDFWDFQNKMIGKYDNDIQQDFKKEQKKKKEK